MQHVESGSLGIFPERLQYVDMTNKTANAIVKWLVLSQIYIYSSFGNPYSFDCLWQLNIENIFPQERMK